MEAKGEEETEAKGEWAGEATEEAEAEPEGRVGCCCSPAPQRERNQLIFFF